jgi:TetR/AcrR family transcriptional regulator
MEAVRMPARRKERNGGVRDLARTRERILRAALAEFSAKGFAGARTDAIARRARINKRMLYYCVGPKQALYSEVLRRKIAEKSESIKTTPDDFGRALIHWYDAGCHDIDWIRMLEWEALGPRPARMIAERERRGLFLEALTSLRGPQRRGDIPASVDLTQLFISIIALAAFPVAFPQMTQLCTGRMPTDPRFQRERRRFLRWLAACVASGSAPRGRARPRANKS